MSTATTDGQKGSEENYLLDKYLLRKVSVHVTHLFSKTSLSPNTVTLASLLCCISSLFFLATNHVVLVIVGCLLVYLYNLLDHVDGELARIRVRTGKLKPSIAGQYFDVLCHSYSANLMLLVTAWAVYSKHGQAWILIPGVIAMSATSGFANLIACKIMIMKVVNFPSVLSAPEAAPVLDMVEKKKMQIHEVNSPIFSLVGARTLVKEVIGYPGILLLIIAAHMIDLFQNGTPLFGSVIIDTRVVLIVVAAIVHGVYTVYLARKYIRLMTAVA